MSLEGERKNSDSSHQMTPKLAIALVALALVLGFSMLVFELPSLKGVSAQGPTGMAIDADELYEYFITPIESNESGGDAPPLGLQEELNVTGGDGFGTNASSEDGIIRLLSSASVPYDSLVAYWSFDADNATSAYDFSGLENTGTYVDNAHTIDGLYDKSASFDGEGDWITVSDSSELDMTSDGSISL